MREKRENKCNMKISTFTVFLFIYVPISDFDFRIEQF